MSTVPKKFCKAPFGSLTVDTDGTLLPCCEFIIDRSSTKKVRLDGSKKTLEQYWNQDLKRLRKSMLDGKIDGGCTHCIQKEDSDVTSSHRWVANNSIKGHYSQIKQEFEENKKFTPKMIELRLGNLCNLKCVMCGPYASSSLMSEYKINKTLFNNFGIGADMTYEQTGNWFKDKVNRETIFDIVSKSSSVNFGGGEPFINPYIVDILHAVPKNVPISFNSNMTRLGKDLIDILSNFEKVAVNVSLDGVGPHHEYLRYGSNWQIIKKNIEQVRKIKNAEIVITYILQHTSVYTFQGVLDFVDDNIFELYIGEVYDASGRLTINSILEKDLKIFKNFVNQRDFKQKHQVNNWIQTYKFDADLHNNFREYFAMLDKVRNTNFAKIFNPSWA